MNNQRDFDLQENILTSFKSDAKNNQSESNNEHFKYKKPIQYWLLVIGYAIGYGSFWRFPYLIYSCGYF